MMRLKVAGLAYIQSAISRESGSGVPLLVLGNTKITALSILSGRIMAVQCDYRSECDYRSDSNNACFAYLIVGIRRRFAPINKYLAMR